ncbi:MAG: uroporphyrinogen decarboxylase family protein, partial [Clostridia bacterium]|nr:uroporphyrinogen decarboxylase family protein [Clostridia bacterium]
IRAFYNAGYDYATVLGSDFKFQSGDINKIKTKSLNDGCLIKDEESYKKYEWPDPDSYDYSGLYALEHYLPGNMKLIVWGNGGVLENVITLVGYDNLCYMIVENPGLAEKIFEEVGSRFVRYYEICSRFNAVGALISNDDWGFASQTLLSPEDLRKYVFPWHKKIVEAIHKSGKPAILHSCGNLSEVMEDIIEDMCYDAKHSFEDKIMPVEEAYLKWGNRIAILGGIDLDFLCRASADEIINRAAKLLKMTAERGGYALGSGNSIPDYVPDEKFLAMISVAK